MPSSTKHVWCVHQRISGPHTAGRVQIASNRIYKCMYTKYVYSKRHGSRYAHKTCECNRAMRFQKLKYIRKILQPHAHHLLTQTGLAETHVCACATVCCARGYGACVSCGAGKCTHTRCRRAHAQTRIHFARRLCVFVCACLIHFQCKNKACSRRRVGGLNTKAWQIRLHTL